MASIILALLQLSFELQKGQEMDKPTRKSDEATINYTLQQNLMRQQWEKNKHLYDHEFVQFVERILKDRS